MHLHVPSPLRLLGTMTVLPMQEKYFHYRQHVPQVDVALLLPRRRSLVFWSQRTVPDRVSYQMKMDAGASQMVVASIVVLSRQLILLPCLLALRIIPVQLQHMYCPQALL